jgi:NADH:ubiquinone reductase (H+-translocating)
MLSCLNFPKKCNMPENVNKSMRIPDLGIPRIVVIGGGFAGVEAVRALKGLDAQ